MPFASEFFRLLVVLCALSPVASFAEWVSQQQNAMGTRISVTVWHEDKAQAQQAIAAVMAEMERIDQTYSPWIETSDLARLNRDAAQAPQTISPEMRLLLTTAYQVSEMTDGAFDITFASVGHLYNYREGRQPTAADIAARKDAIDYHHVVIDGDQVRFADPRVVIDLGGIAKGYAADQAVAIMQQYGISQGSVSAGGDSRLLGDRRGRPWLVGIENPRQPDAIAITLPLSNVAVSTSGDYERFFMDSETGERVHHIINPRSGKSVAGVTSVTIIGERGLDTDPLSTSVFVMGVDKGLAFINRLPGIDAIIIDSHGAVHYSEGLAPPSQ